MLFCATNRTSKPVWYTVYRYSVLGPAAIPYSSGTKRNAAYISALMCAIIQNTLLLLLMLLSYTNMIAINALHIQIVINSTLTII